MLSTVLAWLRAPTLMAWCIAACLVMVAGVTLWFGILIYQAKAREAAEAKVAVAMAQSRTASAHDAVEITASGAARDAATDATTRENADAIQHAPGAEQRLDPGLRAALLRGLCARAAYHSRPECVQLAGPVQP